ncbi:AaceriAEL186Wp [[Ashbya] aceris (nom. inval.)]|nr:AaceriAEL186Wp [[Ashbya] aceris (nom. inval.)]
MQLESKPSQQTNKRIKALDVLDKHISQRSTQRKLQQVPQLLPDEPQISSGGEDEGLPGKIWRGEGRPAGRPRTSPELRAERLNPDEDRATLSASSPLKKSVVFSEEVTSSPIRPTVSSSPVRSARSRPPSKSILKSSPSKSLVGVQGQERALHQFLNPTMASIVAVDPFSLDYWTVGEVHTLSDQNSLAEYKRVLEGAVHLLKQPAGSSRQFEIYATLNGILPSPNAISVSDVDARKLSLTIENIDVLMQISYQKLKQTQERLLLSSKKDPFLSRFYVQIVRFFSNLLTTVRIVKSFERKPHVRSICQSVMDLSLESLNHENTNKVMITAQLTLLREERYGEFFLSDVQIKTFIEAVANIKGIASTNLLYEKHLLLKQYLVKYPDCMLDSVRLWFSTEVLARILVVQEHYNSKLLTSSISIMLELLKVSLVNRRRLEVSLLLNTPAVELLPQLEGKETARSRAHAKNAGQLLRERIKELILESKDYRSAMDIWLCVMGLVYGDPSSLEGILDEEGNAWIKLNMLCHSCNDPAASKLAFKAWRILVYLTFVNFQLNFPRANELMKLLLRPLRSFTESGLNNKSIVEGVNYVISDILYMSFSDPSSSIRFQYLQRHIISPLFMDILPKYKSPAVIQHTEGIFLKLLGKNDDGRQAKKMFNPMRVLSPVGITESDFSAIPFNILNCSWADIMNLVSNMLSFEHIDLGAVLEMFLALLLRVPDSLRTPDNCITCVAFAKRLLLAFEKADTAIEFAAILEKCVSSFFQAFETILFESLSGVTPFYELININEQSAEEQLRWLKLTLDLTKHMIPDVFIVEKFLELSNPAISSYAGNFVGSKLLSATIQPSILDSFLSIVNKVPTSEAIENILEFCTNVLPDSLDILDRLTFLEWDDNAMVFFVKKYSKRVSNGKLDPNLLAMLRPHLFGNTTLFVELSTLLVESGERELMRELVNHHPYSISISMFDKVDMTEALAKELVAQLFTKISELSLDEQYKLLMHAIKAGEVSALATSFDHIKSLLTEEPKNISVDIDILSKDIFALCCDAKEWQLMANISGVLVERNIINHLLMNLEDKANIVVQHFNPVTITAILTRYNDNNSTCDVILRKCFEDQDPFVCFQVLRGLAGTNNFKVFSANYVYLINFLFDPEDRFCEKNREEALELFPVLTNHLMLLPQAIVSEAMEAIKGLVTPQGGEYQFQLLARMVHHPQFAVKGDNRLVNLIRAWKESTSTPKKRPRMFRFISPRKGDTATIQEEITVPVSAGNFMCENAVDRAVVSAVSNDLREDTSFTAEIADNSPLNNSVNPESGRDEDETEQESSDECPAPQSELNGEERKLASHDGVLSIEGIEKISALNQAPSSPPDGLFPSTSAITNGDNNATKGDNSLNNEHQTSSHSPPGEEPVGADSHHIGGLSSHQNADPGLAEDYPSGENHQTDRQNICDKGAKDNLHDPPDSPAPSSFEKSEGGDDIVSLADKQGSDSMVTEKAGEHIFELVEDTHSTPLKFAEAPNGSIEQEHHVNTADIAPGDSPLIANSTPVGQAAANDESLEEEEQDPDVSVVAPLRIPIFKSNHAFYPHLGTHSDEDRIAVKEENTVSFESPEVRQPQPSNTANDASRETTPYYEKPLKAKFPSKKVRRVVSRIQALGEDDIAHMAPDEKDFFRRELLTFIMKLEGL